MLDIDIGILAAHHKSNLAGWVGWDGRVRVLDGWEDLSAIFLKFRN